MFSFKIGYRFLTYNLRRFLGLFFTIMLGTAIFYFIFIAAKGFEDKVYDYASLGEANITLLLPPDKITPENLKKLEAELLENKEIKSIYYSTRVNVSHGSSTFILKGIDFNNQNSHYYKLLNRSHQGEDPTNTLVNDEANHFEVAIGHRLFGKLKRAYHYQGDFKSLDFNFPLKLAENKEIIINASVKKIYYSDIVFFSENHIFVDYQLLQEFSGLDTPTHLEISLKSPLSSNAVIKELTPLLESYFDNPLFFDWALDNDDIINIVYVEKIAVVIIQIITAFAIAIGLMNVLSLHVKEKTQQIGILKAMGITKRETNFIFIIQIAFLSLLSILAGLLFGYGLTVIFDRLAVTGSKDKLIWLNININNKYTLLTFLVMLTFNLLGALIPLLRVNNLTVVKIIKNK